MVRRLCAGFVCLLMLGCVTTSYADVRYKIHEVGQWLDAKDMNNNCEIVGAKRDGAFAWSQSKGFVNLGIYGGGSGSQANAINNNGQAIGFTQIKVISYGHESQHAQAVSWDASGNTTILPNLPGATASDAYDVNDNGDILGLSIFMPYSNQQPPSLADMKHNTVIWHADGSIEDLGQLFANPMYNLISVNNEGLILGRTASNDGNRSFVRHTDGTISYFDTLGQYYHETWGMNEAGQICGTVADPSDNGYKAVIWNSGGNIIRYLDGFSDANINTAYDVNNHGYAVGESSYYQALSDDVKIRACLWSPGGSITQLDSLPGFEISRAYKINDNGWILGEVGTYGDWRTVVWEPVPEPSSVLALLSGVSGLCGVALRRRKS